MEGYHNKSRTNSKEKFFDIFSDFMRSVTKFEELVVVGNKFLVSFQQALEFLRRQPIDKTSALIERTIEANKTKRMLYYVEAGCVNIHDNMQNVSKLHACQLGLWNNLSEAHRLVDELKHLVDDMTDAIQNAIESSPFMQDKHVGDELDLPATTNEAVVSSDHIKPEVSDFGAMMGIVYSMVKKDYMMQEKIVTSLNLKSSSGELESYCLMWALRPFVDDEIMHQAWRLIP